MFLKVCCGFAASPASTHVCGTQLIPCTSPSAEPFPPLGILPAARFLLGKKKKKIHPRNTGGFFPCNLCPEQPSGCYCFSRRESTAVSGFVTGLRTALSKENHTVLSFKKKKKIKIFGASVNFQAEGKQEQTKYCFQPPRPFCLREYASLYGTTNIMAA